MEFTNMTMDCYGTTPTPDTEAFRIEATVTAAGELPTSALFVYTLINSDVPDSDIFARIANPQDLQNLSRNRAAAILEGTTEYLASFASFQYPDLDTAVGAKSAIKGRVNELVNRWIAYQNEFALDSGASTSFPSADPTAETALVTTYTDARDDRIAAEAAFADSDVTVTMTTTELDQAKAYLPTLQRASTTLGQINNNLYTYWNAVSHEGGTATPLRTDLVTFITEEAVHFGSAVQTQVNTIAGLETALNTAKTEKKEAASTLAAAQAAEDAALAAVLAVVPDFDPATV